MLPLSLLRAAMGHPMVRYLPLCLAFASREAVSPPFSPLARRSIIGAVCALGPALQLVELKSGETYNGNLEKCDNWMNLNLREVICTSRVRTQVSRQRSARPVAWALCLIGGLFDHTPRLRPRPLAPTGRRPVLPAGGGVHPWQHD
jgi:hypothetical protein